MAKFIKKNCCCNDCFTQVSTSSIKIINMGKEVNEYNNFLISPQEDEPLKGGPSQCVPGKGLS